MNNNTMVPTDKPVGTRSQVFNNEHPNIEIMNQCPGANFGPTSLIRFGNCGMMKATG